MKLRLVKADEVVVPLELISELLRAGQDLRHSALAGNSSMVAPSRERWMSAELAMIRAMCVQA